MAIEDFPPLTYTEETRQAFERFWMTIMAPLTKIDVQRDKNGRYQEPVEIQWLVWQTARRHLLTQMVLPAVLELGQRKVN